QPAFTLVEKEQQCACDKRNEDGRDQEVRGAGHHLSGSRPSTWSVPVKPRAASRPTRKSAGVAEQKTIADRPKACGTGSVYVDGSTATPFSRTGAAPRRKRPLAKMKRLTA